MVWNLNKINKLETEDFRTMADMEGQKGDGIWVLRETQKKKKSKEICILIKFSKKAF